MVLKCDFAEYKPKYMFNTKKEALAFAKVIRLNYKVFKNEVQ